MIIFSLIITVIYSVLIIIFIVGFNKIIKFYLPIIKPEIKFSVVIPFRNEAHNLPALLESLGCINYPKSFFEILLVDDDSHDDSVAVIDKFIERSSTKDQFDIQILKNYRRSNSPKKDAITTAIEQSNNDWIVTTDADCIVPKNWLTVINAFIIKYQPKLIAAPVGYINTKTFLEKFQLLDLLSMQAVTMGGFGIGQPFLCNGANLCYEKKAFLSVNGFKDNDHIASGDDIFLLEKIMKCFPNGALFLRSSQAMVLTKPEKTLKNLIAQRVRWASKSTNFKNLFAKFVALVVLFMNSTVLILFFLSLFKITDWQFFIAIFILKFIVDLSLIVPSANFFDQNKNLVSYLLSSLIYPTFTVLIVVKVLSKSYYWKDRKYKQ
jgi:cellulose synthase/poly-beta-1,6-N-acetylglucosamine synthase-like glycosyltransferase